MEDYTSEVEAKKAWKQKNLAGAKNTVDAAAMASQKNKKVCAAGPVPRRPGTIMAASDPGPDHGGHGTTGDTESEVDMIGEELLLSCV